MGFLTHAWSVAASTWHKIYTTGHAIDVYIKGTDVPKDSEDFIPITGALSSGAPGATVYESTDVSMYGVFKVKALTQPIQVVVKLTSTDSYGNPMALVDLESLTPGTRVVTTTVGKTYALLGNYYQVKVIEGAGGAANCIGSFSNGKVVV